MMAFMMNPQRTFKCMKPLDIDNEMSAHLPIVFAVIKKSLFL